MANNKNRGAFEYFDRNIDKFDEIYRKNRGGLSGILNDTIRASVKQRFKMTFDYLGDLSGKSVFDIGCGSGRYMIESARRNAKEVIGIDAAAGAIVSARDMAGELGYSDKLEFHVAEFLEFECKKKYDVIFAIGYFDYILDPLDHLRKMLEISGGILIASFPKLWHPLTPIRKFRLTVLNNCQVRFYSQGRLKRLLKEVGCAEYEVRNVARDNILIIDKKNIGVVREQPL
jgi:cyclopropane fatty-acyl-phospholipid synthase-like methyltransferase